MTNAAIERLGWTYVYSLMASGDELLPTPLLSYTHTSRPVSRITSPSPPQGAPLELPSMPLARIWKQLAADTVARSVADGMSFARVTPFFCFCVAVDS